MFCAVGMAVISYLAVLDLIKFGVVEAMT
jgi:hypothetical protein